LAPPADSLTQQRCWLGCLGIDRADLIEQGTDAAVVFDPLLVKLRFTCCRRS
jgi:hypothetical protein